MSFSAQYPPVLTEAGDLTSEVLGKYNQEFQYLYTNLLSTLFSASTGHAHTGNGSDGAQLTAASIANDAITTLKILNEAVTAAKLATDAVTADKILADAVTTVKILNGAITTAKFALDAKCPLAGTADKVANALTVNGTAFDGSAAQEVIFPSHGQQLFTSSGTFTAPDGVTTVYVSGCGGGGGGHSSGYDDAILAGGGGAGCALKTALTVAPNTQYTVTVGAGGAGGAGVAGGGQFGSGGSAGGASSFGSLLTLNGGGGSGSVGGVAGGAGGRCGIAGHFGGDCLFGLGSPGNSIGIGYGSGGGWRSNAQDSAGFSGAQGFILVEW